MGVMSIKDIIYDSVKFTLSDLKVFVLLGMVLFFADIIDEISGTTLMANEIKIVLLILVILLGIFEAGFSFRILTHTINGSKKVPKFNNFGIMFIHGIKEIIILITYFLVPVLLFVLFFSIIPINLENPELNLFILLLLIGITGIVYIFFPAVLLHRAHHNGDLRSGFEFRKIYNKIRRVGFKRLLIVYTGIGILVLIVDVVLADTIRSSVPLFGELIADFVIAPFLLIFSTRFLGLIDR